MAGDWIKMRGNLWDDPRVARLCDMTDESEAAVIGGLYWLWATADQHTEDGIMPGLSLRQIDRKTGVKGLGDALVAIGWLEDNPDGVRIINFEEHNGTSAKKRAVTAKRVANHRSGNADSANDTQAGNAAVTQPALQDEHGGVTGALAREREEKEIEEEKRESFSDKVVGAAPPSGEGEHPPAAQTGQTSSSRGTRLPEDWALPKAWGDWALTEFPHWTADVVRKEADKFADHWRSVSGKAGLKLDWAATWRNWCRSDIAQRAHAPQRITPRPLKPAQMDEAQCAEWERAEAEKARELLFGAQSPVFPGEVLEA